MSLSDLLMAAVLALIAYIIGLANGRASTAVTVSDPPPASPDAEAAS